MTEIIAEIANAHQGSVTNAEKLAIDCLKSGADAVKFQIYFADELLVKTHPRYEHFKNQSFSAVQWKKLISKVKKKGKVYCDIFGEKAFKIAKKLQVDGYKIHSSDLINHHLLKKVSKENKKIFLSTGGSRFSEISYALKYFKNSKIKPILLHGFQSYPTKVEDSKLLRINFLKKNFGHISDIGYQDHTAGNDPFNLYIPLIAMGMGIKVIEKHVTLNRKNKGVDFYSSIEPENLKKFINIIRKSEKALSKNFNSFSHSENNYRTEVKKHWVAKKNFKIKKKIDSNIVMKRVNEKKTEPFYYEDLTGTQIIKKINKESIIDIFNLKKNIIAIIVARSNSKRLRKKAFLKINGKAAIDHLIKRIKLSKKVSKIILCTTKNKEDDKMIKIAKNNKINFFRGPSEDVLKRIMMSLKNEKNIGAVLRITGDDILVDPDYLDKSIQSHQKLNSDYTHSKKLPSGTEAEVFSYNTLKLIYNLAENTSGSEYLTNYIFDNKDFFKINETFIKPKHALGFRLTIDTKQDYQLVKNLLSYMKKKGKEYNYTIDDIAYFFRKFPKYKNINKGIKQKKMPVIFNSKISWQKQIR